MYQVEEIVNLIKNSNNTTVLTGAGMSTDSGIPDYRSSNGVYTKNPELILNRHRFFVKTKKFYEDFTIYMDMEDKEPNEGHKILAEMEREKIIHKTITQNIDGLHSKAGSKNVIELHGNLKTAYCQNPKCQKAYILKDIINEDGTFNYRCDCPKKGLIKPNIILFGDQLKGMNQLFKELKRTELLIVLGTSLKVYPVAAIPEELIQGTPIVIVNYEETHIDNWNNVIKVEENISSFLNIIYSKI